MRILAAILGLTLFSLGSGVATAASTFVGLWQFPNRNVWILIEASGAAFQCRVAPCGTIFTSKGTLVSGDSIQWQKHWPVDHVSITADIMTLQGDWGTFSYERAKRPMSAECDGRANSANNSSERSRGASSVSLGGVDHLDKSAAFHVGAASRRSTS